MVAVLLELLLLFFVQVRFNDAFFLDLSLPWFMRMWFLLHVFLLLFLYKFSQVVVVIEDVVSVCFSLTFFLVTDCG